MTTDHEVEMSFELPEFIVELRRLADALEDGGHFEIAGEQILVPDDAFFSLEHEREEGSEKIEFKLSWDLVADDDDEDEDDDENEDEEEDEEAEEADAAESGKDEDRTTATPA